MSNRDFDDPEYKAWRNAVFALCKYACQFPDCNKVGGHLEAHHIVRWADNDRLRYAVSNGVALCKIHHDLVTGNEIAYQDYFNKIIKQKIRDKRIETKREIGRKSYHKRKKETAFLKRKRKRKKFLRNPRSRF